MTKWDKDGSSFPLNTGKAEKAPEIEETELN